jgi:hypothetical protein
MRAEAAHRASITESDTGAGQQRVDGTAAGRAMAPAAVLA